VRDTAKKEPEPKASPAPMPATAPRVPKPKKAAVPAAPKGTPSPRKAPAKARDIGIDVPLPANACEDQHCPFHGKLSVRGQSLEAVVVATRMQRTVVVERSSSQYMKKYERYEKRTRRMLAHAPACLGLQPGHKVTLMECRPLSKTVSFVVIQTRGAGP